MHVTQSVTAGKRLFLLVIILSLIGILAVFEASHIEAFYRFNDKYFFIKHQASWLGIGLLILITTSLLPVAFWKKLGPLIYFVGIICLILVLIPQLGIEVNGARRWLSLAGFRFQPVEAIKLGITAFFASWLTKHQRIAPFLTFTLLPTTLVMIQPDLGSTLVVLMIAFSMYVTAGGKLKQIMMLGGAGIVMIALLVLTSSYRRERLVTYLNPSHDPLGAGYHIRQITIALGNGGLLGQGIGQSKQKFQYLPEASTDSIFALVAEEIGFVGATLLIGLFLLFLHTAFQIVHNQPDNSFEKLFATGLTVWLAGQMLMNLAAVVALVPLTGVPLPFISRGGSSLLTVMLATGILISLSRNAELQTRKKIR